MKIANIAMDMDLLREAQKCARRLFHSNALAQPEYAALGREIRQLFGKTGDERVTI